MIQFIKQLFGFGAPQETIKEILTPPAKPAKQRAGTVAEVKLAPLPSKTTAAPTKKRKPYYGKKKSAVQEGAQRTNIKTPNPNSARPAAPPAPVSAKKK